VIPSSLTRIAGTAGLYQLDGLLFLLADTAGAPDSLPLDGTWGPLPAKVGYYLFLAETIAAPAAFEAALRPLLLQPSPAASGTAWVAMDANGAPSPACRIDAGADGAVAADAVVTAGAMQLVLPAGTPLLPSRDATGGLAGFTATVPRVPGGGTPNGQGTSVPFFGATGGCVCFTGLFNLFSTPSFATTQVVNVQLDPLRPGDGTRTRVDFTDTTLSLVSNGSGVRLELDAA
jgi:hypothetical protein